MKISNKLFVVLIIVSLSMLPMQITRKITAADPDPFFYINVLCPNTNPARNSVATMMLNEFPKIGIGIDVFDHTGWSQISPRTWGYPGPYPVPIYSDGGFDVLFVGWGWGLDINFNGLFNTAGWPPNGDNFYQYSDPQMDAAISDFQQAWISADRLDLIDDMQQILYEDNPTCLYMYPMTLYPHHENFTGWDGVLWNEDHQTMDDWSISGQSEFHYATPANFEDFHIYMHDSFYDAGWLKQIYTGLFAGSPGTHTYTPRLATSWTSSDGLTFDIQLDSNAKWADGVALTTADVNYSYNLIIDPTFSAPSYTYWNQYIDSDSVSIIDADECQITFKQVYVFQENNLALELMPKHIWESIAPADQTAQAASWALTDPGKIMGAGPYYLHDYNNTHNIIHLKANPYYRNLTTESDPIFSDVFFEYKSSKAAALAALDTGDIDMIDGHFSPQLYEIPVNASYTLVKDGGSQEMAFNNLHPYFGTGDSCPIPGAQSANYVRKAINHIFPREFIATNIYNGLAVPGVTAYSHTGIGFDETLEPYEYNITLAKSYMELAGFNYDPNATTTPPTTTPSPTTSIGFSLGSTFGILSLLAGSVLIQIIITRKRK